MPQENVWTIKRCLEWTRDYLASKGDDHSRLSAEWLLSAATGKDRTGLYMSYDEPLDPAELNLMHGFVARRAKGEPLQYISGKTSFRFIEVACAPGVLIPCGARAPRARGWLWNGLRELCHRKRAPGHSRHCDGYFARRRRPCTQ